MNTCSSDEASGGVKAALTKVMSARPIFVAATRQHVGKTTVSLAILSGLQKRFGKVGFIKPVGQQHIAVNDGGRPQKTSTRRRRAVGRCGDCATQEPVYHCGLPAAWARDDLF